MDNYCHLLIFASLSYRLRILRGQKDHTINRIPPDIVAVFSPYQLRFA
jgi:hypothetical protein